MNEETDLGASKPVEEKHEPTESEIKEWRNRNWTIRNNVVVACGHQLNLRNAPTQVNCFDCWEAWFKNGVSPEQMQFMHNILIEQGTQGLVRLTGKKFVKMFGKYLQKKLLQQASPEIQAASGIEVQGSPMMEVKSLEETGA